MTDVDDVEEPDADTLFEMYFDRQEELKHIKDLDLYYMLHDELVGIMSSTYSPKVGDHVVLVVKADKQVPYGSRDVTIKHVSVIFPDGRVKKHTTESIKLIG